MKIMKKLALACSMFFGISFLVSCGSNSNDNNVDSTDTMVIVHDNGETNVKKNPEKVVTFDYGSLDILENLGVEIAGLPKGSLPSSLEKYNDAKYEDLGGLKEPDFEAINALKPELIIISGRQADMYDKFNEIAPTILLEIDGSKYMEDLTKNANILGRIFGKEDVVSQKLEEINTKISELNELVTSKDSNALTILVNEGSLSAYGSKSRFGIIYNNFGFKPVDDTIVESTHGQQISFEYIVDKNPEYLFVIDRGSAVTGESTAKTVLDNELIRSIDAYKNGKILYLDSQSWYLVSGGFNSTNSMIDEVKNFVENFN